MIGVVRVAIDRHAPEPVQYCSAQPVCGPLGGSLSMIADYDAVFASPPATRLCDKED
jgi:hypothetical protein